MDTIFEISGDDITTLLGYIAQVFSDLSPIILLIVGVGVGLMVIAVIIKALRG
jgi:hypothetical protein